jgi:hypothetical protein
MNLSDSQKSPKGECYSSFPSVFREPYVKNEESGEKYGVAINPSIAQNNSCDSTEFMTPQQVGRDFVVVNKNQLESNQ